MITCITVYFVGGSKKLDAIRYLESNILNVMFPMQIWSKWNTPSDVIQVRRGETDREGGGGTKKTALCLPLLCAVELEIG